LASVGCESIALVGRESLKLEAAEVVAEVEQLDSRSKEIHLRPNSKRIKIIAYTDDTRVIYRGREQAVDDLRPGDVIAMQVKEEPPGRYRTEFLSIRERRETRDGAR
jgi:hypothetical protein